jgi:hypothetical protein
MNATPYESNLVTWERLPWVDRHSRERFRITTTGPTGGPGFARVQTYREVLEAFWHHPEAKSSDANGRPCGWQARGLLRRRRVCTRPELLTYVGKESNKLEEVASGLEHDPDAVYTAYPDPERDLWNLVVPVLQRCNLSELATKSGITLRQLRNLADGRDRPRRATRTRILDAFRRMGLSGEDRQLLELCR